MEEKALATAAKGIVPENPSEAGPLPQAAADALAAQAAASAQAALEPQAAADAVAMQGWTEGQVCELVTRCFPKFDASIFRDSGVNGEVILEATDDELIGDMGLNRLQVRRIRKEIQKSGYCTAGCSGPRGPSLGGATKLF